MKRAMMFSPDVGIGDRLLIQVFGKKGQAAKYEDAQIKLQR
jgi:hypothetical protein